MILTGFAQAENYDPGPVRADESETPRPRLQGGYTPLDSWTGIDVTGAPRSDLNSPNPATVSPNHFIGERPNNRKESKLKKTLALLFRAAHSFFCQ